MFKRQPGEETEYGRNDTGKMGFFVVRVYENGQVTRFIRSNGAVVGPDEYRGKGAAALRSLHSDESFFAPVGFELRHP
jgi:hypothetical protein